ncbi:organic solute transporter alpha-like protein [Condylostylus longicornis]|uniref:organic solute transporter alpha-like protein n=1 Tax=Condylostylus longicornis TaxID=2530218 RepID=UPI00244DA916|nr:organic solute transporter alpha-like protein [Condylostylus longicornis]
MINLNIYTTLSIVLAIIVFFINIAIFCASVTQSLKRVRKLYLGSTIFLLSLYPIISFAALITILIPRSFLICHTIMHLLFTFGAFIYYRLCILYVNGLENFLKEADAEILNVRTPPCCCCCLCIHSIALTKNRMNILFYMITQLPCIQFVIMLILNFIYVYEESIYKVCNWYFAPFMFTSILTGVWGLNIVTRMVDSHVKNLNMKKKFFALQFILIFCKLQFIILNSSLDGVYLGSQGYPITDTVYKQAIINILITLEMILLSLLAKQAYKEPTHL